MTSDLIPFDDEPFEQIGTGSKKTRGMAWRSLKLIDAMAEITEAARPITGRGVGYKLFVARLIKSMAQRDMKRVYRLLKLAREREIIPWDWIVDETRGVEQIPSWDDPEDFALAVTQQYRRDFWAQQPERCQVWSEKGTVRGILRPKLDEYGVGFNPVHGFNSATNLYEAATDRDPRPLTILYVGDWDPSGLYMSERDLPARFAKYGGDHITVKRIALVREQLADLPSFPASDKHKCRSEHDLTSVDDAGQRAARKLTNKQQTNNDMQEVLVAWVFLSNRAKGSVAALSKRRE
jgi:hypothetical protein